MTLLELLQDHTTTPDRFNETPEDWSSVYAYHDNVNDFLFVKPIAFHHLPFVSEGIRGFLDSDQLLGERTLHFFYTLSPVRALVFDLQRQDKRLDFTAISSSKVRLVEEALRKAQADRKARRLEEVARGVYVPRKRQPHLLKLLQKHDYLFDRDMHYRELRRVEGTNTSQPVECIDGSGFPGDTYQSPAKRGAGETIGYIYRRFGPGWHGANRWWVWVDIRVLEEWREALSMQGSEFSYKDDARYSHTENKTIDGVTLRCAVFNMLAPNEPHAKARPRKTPNENRQSRKERREALQRERELRISNGENLEAETLEAFLQANAHRRGRVCRREGAYLYVVIREMKQTTFKWKSDPRYVSSGVKYFRPWQGLSDVATGAQYCAVFDIS